MMTSQNPSFVSPCWKLQQQHASLKIGELCGLVDLQRPERGIGQLVFQDNPLPGYLLGIAVEGEEHPANLSIREHYVRGSDLVVCYDLVNGVPADDELPYSLQICWRATVSHDGHIETEAVVSLQTSLLESYPRLAASSRLEGAKVVLSDQLARCAIFRLPDGETSYLEAVAPGDSVGPLAAQPGAAAPQTSWPLGGDFLEKGVLRRAQIRSQWVPRDQDEVLAAKLQASLKTEQPPIST